MILDQFGVPIDEIWAAEFRGFFWGEGCLSVMYIPKKDLYRVLAKIGLRSDDRPLLEEIHRRIGGSLWDTTTQSSAGLPSTMWDASSQKSLKIVAELLLGGVLPAKKAKQLDLWLEAVSIFTTRKIKCGWGGKQYTDEQKTRMGEIKKALSEAKKFSF